MKNRDGTFVTTGQPTAEQACLGVLGMQLASAIYFISENADMFTDAVSDDEFEQWLEGRTWVK